MKKVSGLWLAASYGLPPCRLGYCGRGKRKAGETLRRFLLGKEKNLKRVRRALEGFEALYPYLQLIAQANRRADPLEKEVVEAYWLGNRLLERVKPAALKKLITTVFCRPGLLTFKQAKQKAAMIRKGALPHHSFHVLVMGSITGRVSLTGRLVDVCRIGWGKVEKLSVGSPTSPVWVSYQPLLTGKEGFYWGKEKRIKLEREPWIGKLRKGDWVSFHWGRVCQRLTKLQVRNLERYTQRIVNYRNALLKEENMC